MHKFKVEVGCSFDVCLCNYKALLIGLISNFEVPCRNTHLIETTRVGRMSSTKMQILLSKKVNCCAYFSLLFPSNLIPHRSLFSGICSFPARY